MHIKKLAVSLHLRTVRIVVWVFVAPTTPVGHNRVMNALFSRRSADTAQTLPYFAFALSTVASIVAVIVVATFVPRPDAANAGLPARSTPTLAQTAPFPHPGVYRLADGSYEAYVTADGSQFSPSTITVPVHSSVTFFVTSTNTVRGFSIPELGVFMMAGPGWVKTATHEFERPDTYVLVCSQYCSPDHLDMHAIIKVQ